MRDEIQKDEIILVVKKVIAVNTAARDIDDIVELDSNDVDHIAEAVADKLYADGWRKDGLICKAGDTIYQTDTDGERIYKSTVNE